jgi:uncharacterized protein YkwD
MGIPRSAPTEPSPPLSTRTLIALPLVASILVATPGAEAAGRCSGAGALPAAGNSRQVERTALCLINAQRRAHGLGRLRSNPLLRLAAVRHSRDMVAREYFSHTGPSGSDFVARIRDAGYIDTSRSWRVGETIACGTGVAATPATIVRGWMRSPPHRRILLAPGFRGVGIGIALGTPTYGGRGATYTADFGGR